MAQSANADKSEPYSASWIAYTDGPVCDSLIDYGSHFDQTVYQDIECRDSEFRVISVSEAAAYLPNRKTPVTFVAGIETPKDATVEAQDSVALHPTYFKYKRSFVINSGGSIWGLDFAPKPPSAANQHIQYLAIAGYPGTTDEHHNVGEIQEPGSAKNCIQIWRLDLRLQGTEENPIAKPTLDLCIAHDFGIVRALRWCPYGTYQEAMDGQTFTPRLGIMAVAFGDGTIKIISVPHPDGIRSKSKGKRSTGKAGESQYNTVYVKMEEALATLSIPDTCLSTISWGGPFKLIAASSKGTVSLWNVKMAIRNRVGSNKDTAEDDIALTLTYNVKVHPTAIREALYHSPHDSNEHDFATCGYDGRLQCFDDRDPQIGQMYWKNRGFMNAATWPVYSDMIFFTDVERCVRSIRTIADPEHAISRRLTECKGDVWQLASSYYHPFIAAATSDGWLKMANPFPGGGKKGKPYTNHIYRMRIQKDPNKYQYVDGIKSMAIPNRKGRPGESLYYLFLDPEMAVQKCTWSPNKSTCGWIASGGAAGLCRVDFVGEGKNWLEFKGDGSMA